MALGDITKVVSAKNVRLTVGTTDEVITLTKVRFSDESIVDRKNTRGGPIDTPTYAIEEIVAHATLSKLLNDHFRALRILSARGALPVEAFVLKGEAITEAADDFQTSGTYFLRKYESEALETGTYDAILTIRIVSITG